MNSTEHGATAPMIEVLGLKKYFPIRTGVFSRVQGYLKAVDGVSFTILPGETYGLVGESGCGKSTIGHTILKMLEPTAGKVLYKGRDVFSMGKQALRNLRREVQIVFQDPYSSLNPRKTVGGAIGEALTVHGIASGAERRKRVEHVLEVCGLARYHYRRYPHEFSGGQRQRLVIARALALNPQFIVADEPISALDVSIQSQIINLMERLQDEFGLTFLLISHDLSVVKHMSDRVGVMYLGTLVEEAPKKEFYASPLHPYSQALISAIPSMDPERPKDRIILKGDVPSPASPPEGCRFHTRCPRTAALCHQEVPELKAAKPGHLVACHLLHGENK
jgi:oligopeptide/dipeptide ABC transporter ATP-binding protein